MAESVKYFIVSYDISDPLRLTRIGKVMKDYGERVLKSVFECSLDEIRYFEMKEKVSSLMEMETDSVRYYYICDKCLKLVENLGKRKRLKKDKDFTII